MKLEIFSDMSERLRYNMPGFPLETFKGELRQFDRHWHPDLEFLLVLDGAMEFFVNGQTICIGKGEGIFVNSKRLHYGLSLNSSDCSFINAVVNPAILGENTPAGKTFFDLKFGSDTEDYILLKPEIQWQNESLALISRIFEEMHTSGNNPIRLLSLAASLCACTADNLQPLPIRKENGSNANSWLSIRNMTGFIFQNYGGKITLDDIATAGSVCRSKCCQIFGEYVGQTPNTYLTGYRVKKSCEMLKESKMSVLEVALACGFSNPSYFAQVFQSEVGVTPKEYRKQSYI
jgi:AraC-like DNA-binding protein